MIKKAIIGGFLLLLPFLAKTQPYEVKASNKALNTVLVELREQYKLQLSFSDNALSSYKISMNQSFGRPEELLEALIKDLPFLLKKSGEVYILVPVKPEKKKGPAKKTTQITGKVVEADSYEPLPFSHILINNQSLISDVTGSFNYIASADSNFRVQISHLGYYVYDTIVSSTTNQTFTLTPATEQLKEIMVENNIIEKASLIGDKAGNMKINHNISRFLPGQGDNSVFNLLRLMPGIQAAGEQSTDLLIWGSYAGQSQITFDGFTVFGLKNFNDNISTVNPFVVKNIEIYKGGYEAKYGNRVGAIVNITGKNGSLQKPILNLNINHTTVNGMLEVPLFKRSSLLLAYRQTYYNLYNAEDFNIYAPTRNNQKGTSARNLSMDVNTYPDDYAMRDMNMKYTYRFKNKDLFYISAYRGSDFFSLITDAEIEQEKQNKKGKKFSIPFRISFENNEENTQNALSAFYSHKWTNQLSSSFTYSYSDFSEAKTTKLESENLANNVNKNNDLDGTSNTAAENSFRTDNTYYFKNAYQLDFGLGYYRYQASLNRIVNLQDTIRIDTLSNYNNRNAYVYAEESWPLGDKTQLKTGLRLNYAAPQNRFYLQPRIGLHHKLTKHLKINFSWGKYAQFMYKIASVDRDNNYTYLWVVSQNKVPVLTSTHWVSGLSYNVNTWNFNLEAYSKNTDNISRQVFEQRVFNGQQRDAYFPIVGIARTKGIDFYAKKDFGKNAVWATYTLSKSEEKLAPVGRMLPADYDLAPHDQRHEFKIAAITHWKNFYLSGNYVYGSGMQNIRETFHDLDDIRYRRVDVALTYKFSGSRMHGETGLSILNVFDTQNLKYENLRNIRITQGYPPIRVYSNAVPFSPTLFLKIVF